MIRKTLTTVAPVALLSLGLAACDNTEEYEARIAELEGQLQEAEGQVGEYETQVADLETQLEELQAAEPAAGAEGLDVEVVRTEIETALGTLRDIDERIGELEGQVEGPAAETVVAVREDLEGVARALGGVAEGVGVDPQNLAPAEGGAVEVEEAPEAGAVEQGVTEEVEEEPAQQ